MRLFSAVVALVGAIYGLSVWYTKNADAAITGIGIFSLFLAAEALDHFVKWWEER